MMEVKQNTAVDLNELMAPSKTTEDIDELDDVIMDDLSDETPSTKDLNCDLIKSKGKIKNGLSVVNADAALSSLIDIDSAEDAALDEDVPVSPEIEDALLAEDVADVTEIEEEALLAEDVPVPSEIEDALLAEDEDMPDVSKIVTNASPSLDSEADLLADKVETSSSTTISSNDRDPGDDLDTLLSKINDIVDDCLDHEANIVDDCLDQEATIEEIPLPKIIEEKNTNAEQKEKKEVAENNISCASPDESVVLVDSSVEEKDTTEVQKTPELAKCNSSENLSTTENKIVKDDTDDTEIKESNTTQQSETCEKSKDEDQHEASTDDVQVIEDDDEIQTETCDQPESKDDGGSADDANVLSVEKEPKESSNEGETNIVDIVEKDSPALSNSEESEKDYIPTNNDDTSTHVSLEQCNQEDDKKETNKDTEEALHTDDAAKKESTESGQGSEEAKKDAEESDDEIVFYEDEKNQECKKDTNLDSTKENEDYKSKDVNNKSCKETPASNDDEVVILDDDDEEEGEDKKVGEPQKDITTEKTETVSNEAEDTEKSISLENKEPNSETSPQHSTQIDVDNSDNACDDFVSEKTAEAETITEQTTETSTGEISSKPKEIEEANSNCSSSSNLLLEAKLNENSSDGRNQEDNDNDNDNENEEDDDGDVELIENEAKESEISFEKGDELVPPAKRPRLSEDSQISLNVDDICNKGQMVSEALEEKIVTQDEATPETISPSLKRSRNAEELDVDENSNDSLSKKARREVTVENDNKSVAVSDTSELKPTQKEEEDTKEIKTEEKFDIKNVVPSYTPIPLYPPPNLEPLTSENTISLDFFKKFRKSFDKMTKQDLEELVMQKVVEAIIHKTEFADMRELIEKQEKIIAVHRAKITELSKQFRDLEMVHNRVVKDIEQRNSQFIMPVKITRAVGLQVYIPNKKNIMDSGSTTSNMSINTSPQRSVSSGSSITSLTSPQRPGASVTSHSSDVSARPTTTLPTITNSNVTNVVRRGCAQKITPTRPVPNSSSSSASNNTLANTAGASAYRSGGLGQTTPLTQPRILNKNATQSVSAGGTSSPANAAASTLKNRFVSPNMENVRLAQQSVASRPVANQRVLQPKPTGTPVTVVPRRTESGTSASANNTPSLDNYMSTLSQLTGGNTAVSITPAKPKEKAVIDLTDEDETAPATAPAATLNNSTSNGPANINPPQRRSLPLQANNANSTPQFGRSAPPLARIPPNNQVSNANRNRQTAAQGQRSTNSTYSSAISAPAGTSITRINVTSSNQTVQRVKYSHPAPLPATPPQVYNHSWKLPPPRPSIRISNANNGIVISWSFECAMEPHAECVSYQIYAYQETSGPPMGDSWRHVGDVKAMLLPMAVTLTQFQEDQRYFFAVRAVDCHQRYGPFSLPKTWS